MDHHESKHHHGFQKGELVSGFEDDAKDRCDRRKT